MSPPLKHGSSRCGSGTKMFLSKVKQGVFPGIQVLNMGHIGSNPFTALEDLSRDRSDLLRLNTAILASKERSPHASLAAMSAQDPKNSTQYFTDSTIVQGPFSPWLPQRSQKWHLTLDTLDTWGPEPDFEPWIEGKWIFVLHEYTMVVESCSLPTWTGYISGRALSLVRSQRYGDTERE